MAGSITDEVPVAVPAERMWRVAFADTKSAMALLPKACPGYIDALEVDGDGGAGSVTTMKINPSLGGDAKTRTVVFDAAARVIKTEVLEGGTLGAELKTNVAEVKVEAAGDGACVAKLKVDYERHDGGPLAPEDQAKLVQGYVQLLKMVEAYLVAHPDEFP